MVVMHLVMHVVVHVVVHVDTCGYLWVLVV